MSADSKRDAHALVVDDRLVDPAWLKQQERNAVLGEWSRIDDVEAEQHAAAHGSVDA